MDDAIAVQCREAARHLRGQSPKLVIVLNAFVWFDAASQMACDEFSDDKTNFAGGDTRAQVRHNKLDVCDKFVHLRLVLMHVIVCRHFQNA